MTLCSEQMLLEELNFFARGYKQSAILEEQKKNKEKKYMYKTNVKYYRRSSLSVATIYNDIFVLLFLFI